MIIVLVSGKAESGKDTFHQLAEKYIYSRNLYSPNVHRVAFGDGVKKVAEQMGWNGEKDEKGRSGLIMVGDGAREFFDKNIWIKKAVQRLSEISTSNNDYDNSSNKDAIVFVTDCRYPNEVTMLKDWAYLNSHPVYAVRVERPNHVSKLTNEQLMNMSETALDNRKELFDFIVVNDKTLDDFTQKVKEVMDKIVK